MGDPERVGELVGALSEPLPTTLVSRIDVLSSSGSDAALELFDARRPHVLVVTASQRGGDTAALVEAIRGRLPRAEIGVVVVGDGEGGAIRNALDAIDLAPDRFVSRPMAPRTLRFAVASALEAVLAARAAATAAAAAAGEAARPAPEAFAPVSVATTPGVVPRVRPPASPAPPLGGAADSTRAALRRRWEALADSMADDDDGDAELPADRPAPSADAAVPRSRPSSPVLGRIALSAVRMPVIGRAELRAATATPEADPPAAPDERAAPPRIADERAAAPRTAADPSGEEAAPLPPPMVIRPRRLGTVESDALPRVAASRGDTAFDAPAPSRPGTASDEVAREHASRPASRLGTAPDEVASRHARPGTAPDEVASRHGARPGTAPDEVASRHGARPGRASDEVASRHGARPGTASDEVASHHGARPRAVEPVASGHGSRASTAEPLARAHDSRAGTEPVVPHGPRASTAEHDGPPSVEILPEPPLRDPALIIRESAEAEPLVEPPPPVSRTRTGDEAVDLSERSWPGEHWSEPIALPALRDRESVRDLSREAARARGRGGERDRPAPVHSARAIRADELGVPDGGSLAPPRGLDAREPREERREPRTEGRDASTRSRESRPEVREPRSDAEVASDDLLSELRRDAEVALVGFTDRGARPPTSPPGAGASSTTERRREPDGGAPPRADDAGHAATGDVASRAAPRGAGQAGRTTTAATEPPATTSDPGSGPHSLSASERSALLPSAPAARLHGGSRPPTIRGDVLDSGEPTGEQGSIAAAPSASRTPKGAATTRELEAAATMRSRGDALDPGETVEPSRGQAPGAPAASASRTPMTATPREQEAAVESPQAQGAAPAASASRTPARKPESAVERPRAQAPGVPASSASRTPMTAATTREPEATGEGPRADEPGAAAPSASRTPAAVTTREPEATGEGPRADKPGAAAPSASRTPPAVTTREPEAAGDGPRAQGRGAAVPSASRTPTAAATTRELATTARPRGDGPMDTSEPSGTEAPPSAPRLIEPGSARQRTAEPAGSATRDEPDPPPSEAARPADEKAPDGADRATILEALRATSLPGARRRASPSPAPPTAAGPVPPYARVIKPGSAVETNPRLPPVAAVGDKSQPGASPASAAATVDPSTVATSASTSSTASGSSSARSAAPSSGARPETSTFARPAGAVPSARLSSSALARGADDAAPSARLSSSALGRSTDDAAPSARASAAGGAAASRVPAPETESERAPATGALASTGGRPAASTSEVVASPGSRTTTDEGLGSVGPRSSTSVGEAGRPPAGDAAPATGSRTSTNEGIGAVGRATTSSGAEAPRDVRGTTSGAGAPRAPHAPASGDALDVRGTTSGAADGPRDLRAAPSGDAGARDVRGATSGGAGARDPHGATSGEVGARAWRATMTGDAGGQDSSAMTGARDARAMAGAPESRASGGTGARAMTGARDARAMAGAPESRASGGTGARATTGGAAMGRAGTSAGGEPIENFGEEPPAEVRLEVIEGLPDVAPPAPSSAGDGGDFARQLRAKMSRMAQRLFQGADAPAPAPADLAPRHDHSTEIDLSSLGEELPLGGVTEIEARPAARPVATHEPGTAPGTWETSARERERGLPDQGEIVRGTSDAAVLLARMFAGGTTGRIHFRRDDGETIVYFDQGRPVFASSSEARDRMGELLVREGKITAAQYERCQGVVAESGRRMGEILVDLGYLKRRELLPAVRRHVEDLVYALFGWDRGQYRIAHEAQPSAERIRLSRHPAALVLEGVRRKLDRTTLERLLGPSSTVIEVGDRERLGAVINTGDLSAEERAALAAFDGQADLAQVARTAGVDVADVLPLAWGLCVLGLATARRADTEVHDESTALVGETDLAIDRERVRARWQLVTEADYFALLGVRRDATAFEIRRAYQSARRDFAADGFPTDLRRELAQELDDIANVLDEAFRVLRDDRLRRTYLSNLVG